LKSFQNRFFDTGNSGLYGTKPVKILNLKLKILKVGKLGASNIQKYHRKRTKYRQKKGSGGRGWGIGFWRTRFLR